MKQLKIAMFFCLFFVCHHLFAQAQYSHPYIYGRLTTYDDQPIAGAKIVNLSYPSEKTFSDASGYYRMEVSPGRPCIIDFSADNHRNQQETFILIPGQVREINPTLDYNNPTQRLQAQRSRNTAPASYVANVSNTAYTTTGYSANEPISLKSVDYVRITAKRAVVAVQELTKKSLAMVPLTATSNVENIISNWNNCYKNKP